MDSRAAQTHLSEEALKRLVQGDATEAEARAAQQHLAACAACRSRHDSVAAVGEGTAIGATLAPSNPTEGDSPVLARGTSLGRYVVLDLLGQGGMGQVYAAFDPELNRRVAVKLLRARKERDAQVPDDQARLLREAQAMARLSHPNVVAIYDVGAFNDSSSNS